MITFKDFYTRPVVKKAFILEPQFEISVLGNGDYIVTDPTDATASVHVIFKSHKSPSADDWIVAQSNEDIYLVPAQVFKEKYYT